MYWRDYAGLPKTLGENISWHSVVCKQLKSGIESCSTLPGEDILLPSWQ